MQTTLDLCPCGSGESFSDCCDRYISGALIAPTPESLMRSRYTAYTQNNIDYIKATIKGQALKDFDYEQSLAWAKMCDWDSLEVIASSEPNEDEGLVEFKAFYRLGGIMKCLHENSQFKKIEGCWYYIGNGAFRVSDCVSHKSQKIKRNDPCYCGSGKKYKKCCYHNG